MKSYAIISTGAIGGYCAVKLAQAGFEVHCLLRSDYQQVKQHGLTVGACPTLKVKKNHYLRVKHVYVHGISIIFYANAKILV